MVYHNGLGMERGRLRRRETVRIVVTYGDWRINQFREDFKNIPPSSTAFYPVDLWSVSRFLTLFGSTPEAPKTEPCPVTRQKVL